MKISDNSPIGIDVSIGFVSRENLSHWSGLSGSVERLESQRFSMENTDRGRKFREIRRGSSLSLDETARRFNSSAADISAIEAGRKWFDDVDIKNLHEMYLLAKFAHGNALMRAILNLKNLKFISDIDCFLGLTGNNLNTEIYIVILTATLSNKEEYELRDDSLARAKSILESRGKLIPGMITGLE